LRLKPPISLSYFLFSVIRLEKYKAEETGSAKKITADFQYELARDGEACSLGWRSTPTVPTKVPNPFKKKTVPMKFIHPR
jgi:hypothetical protein